MTHKHRSTTTSSSLMPSSLMPSSLMHMAVLLAGVLVALPSAALYKVVGPDGKVTYTDRAPGTKDGRISPLAGQAAPAAAFEVNLPLELREVVGKYPVTLYSVTGGCGPCDSAKQLLRNRGIPFSEKQVVSAEDSEALQRLSGGQDAPTLAIGSQILRGLAPEVWNSYLDAAGYPRESKLPTGYQYPPATPITERREAAPRAAAPAPASAPAPATAPPAPSTGGIRF